MALFTSEQADACTINRCESFKLDDVHQYWIISVSDEHGCTYEWRDSDLASDANEATIKAAAKAILLTKECMMPQPAKSHDSLDTILGQTIGE